MKTYVRSVLGNIGLVLFLQVYGPHASSITYMYFCNRATPEILDCLVMTEKMAARYVLSLFSRDRMTVFCFSIQYYNHPFSCPISSNFTQGEEGRPGSYGRPGFRGPKVSISLIETC